MAAVRLVIFSIIVTLASIVTCSPVKFDDTQDLQGQQRSLSPAEEARVFHAHALKKRKKKKLLQCLLSLQRNAQKPQGDARFLLFNYMNVEYNVQGGNGPYHDDTSDGDSGNSNNCLSQFTGGGGQSGSGLNGFGEGIDNLSSFVGQVPGNVISSVGDVVKPVIESPERYINRYIIRPIYRSLRPLYRWF